MQSDRRVSERHFLRGRKEETSRHITKRYSRLHVQRDGEENSSSFSVPFHKNILPCLDKSKSVEKAPGCER